MIFRDRADAGQRLAELIAKRLPGVREERPIVLAIPRGGVPVGFEVAQALDAPLDVFIARKLGAPGQEELGIGAVAPGGTRFLDMQAIRDLGVRNEYIEQVTAKELVELERRMERYRGDRPAPSLGERAIVLVDDGLATGVTALAALAALRLESPRRLIFAAPVCSVEGAEVVAQEADDVVCVAKPDRFYGVGAWYHDFSQISDEEVIDLLELNASRRDASRNAEHPYEKSRPAEG